jgi:vitamin B12/bleomycin/antimicrobial peptide transport system ATP-binding/permease protein
MSKLDSTALQRFRKIAPLFFKSDLKWHAIGLLALLTAFSISICGLNVLMNFINGDFFTALSLRERDEFLKQLYLYLGAFFLATPVVVFYRYTEERLGLLWRKWLSRHLLQRYYAHRNYYRINYLGNIDNPDQRIVEDVRSFTSTSLSFLLIIFNSLIAFFAFIWVLWKISIYLVIAVIAYALFGSLITYFLGKPLIGLNFSQLKKDADYRYKLINIRDNAESIAFLGDEKKELTRTRQRLKVALENLRYIINWNMRLNFFTTGYNYLVPIIPVVIVAPLFLEGSIEWGDISRASSAFTQVLGALAIFVSNFGSISAFAAVVNRLGSFCEALDEAEAISKSSSKCITTKDGDLVSFNKVTILTPKHDQTLVKELSFELQKGGLLITGQSGSGKSSILRTIAGLWNMGHGEIIRPPLHNSLFIPQRPYMVLGTFRNQLLYGVHKNGLSDKHLLETLKSVGLEETNNRLGGLDVSLDWPSILSTGEQQKLSFARLLLARPTFAILDEATTALDQQSEDMLYHEIRQQCPLFISVGYHSTLKKYHDFSLSLELGGKWKFEKIK